MVCPLCTRFPQVRAAAAASVSMRKLGGRREQHTISYPVVVLFHALFSLMARYHFPLLMATGTESNEAGAYHDHTAGFV